jgi:hypothetical protein
LWGWFLSLFLGFTGNPSGEIGWENPDRLERIGSDSRIVLIGPINRGGHGKFSCLVIYEIEAKFPVSRETRSSECPWGKTFPH